MKNFVTRNKIVIVIFISFFLLGMFVGSHNFYDTYLLPNGSYEIEFNYYKTTDALDSERRLCNATSEMLHYYWENYDTITINEDTLHPVFDNIIRQTWSFHIADSIREGDWEDFFYNWKENL